MSLVTRLRETTRLMATRTSSPMGLWDEHSNAVLKAASEIERYQSALRNIRDCPGTAKQLQDIAIVTLGVDGYAEIQG